MTTNDPPLPPSLPHTLMSLTKKVSLLRLPSPSLSLSPPSLSPPLSLSLPHSLSLSLSRRQFNVSRMQACYQSATAACNPHLLVKLRNRFHITKKAFEHLCNPRGKVRFARSGSKTTFKKMIDSRNSIKHKEYFCF